ncbi:MAG: histidine kinase, partial [Cytophagales bacterium CG18_big_fil_WC_8_21_14_2_50_42_9]
IKGPEHRYELINQNYQKLFPNRVLLNKTVAEALPEVIDQGFIDILDNVYKTGKTFMAEETLIKIDRYDNHQLEDVYLTFTYQPLYKEDEQIIGIIVFGYEVTEQVLLKKKLEELGNA